MLSFPCKSEEKITEYTLKVGAAVGYCWCICAHSMRKVFIYFCMTLLKYSNIKQIPAEGEGEQTACTQLASLFCLIVFAKGLADGTGGMRPFWKSCVLHLSYTFNDYLK